MNCTDCVYFSLCDYDASKYNFKLPENVEKCSFFSKTAQK